MTADELRNEIRDLEGLRRWGDLTDEQLAQLEALYESLDEQVAAEEAEEDGQDVDILSEEEADRVYGTEIIPQQ